MQGAGTHDTYGKQGVGDHDTDGRQCAGTRDTDETLGVGDHGTDGRQGDIGSVDHFGYLWPQKITEVGNSWLQT